MAYNEIDIDWLEQIIVPAIDMFYTIEHDMDLVVRNASERAIVANVYCKMSNQSIVKQFQHIPFASEDALVTLLVACVGLILLAVNLPFIFKMGVEKGRLIFMVIIAATVFAMMMAGDKIKAMLSSNFMDPALLSVLAVITAVVTNVISVTVSNSIYKKKAF